MSEVEKKLDLALELLSKIDKQTSKVSTIEELEEVAKDKITDFMLEHYNISFINDETEKKIYNGLLDVIFTILNKFL